MSNNIVENRVLYNHYGDENEMKIQDVSNIFDNKLRQINYIYERNLSRIKHQKKIDKDLFLRSKYKLINDKKRNLESIKIEAKNNKKILKHSLSELIKISTMKGFLKYEISKVSQQIKKNEKYLESSFKWSKKSADDPEIKIVRFNEIKERCKEKEKEFFKVKNALTFLLEQETDSKKDMAEDLKAFSIENESLINEIKLKLKHEIKKIISKKDLLNSKIKAKLIKIKEDYQTSKKEIIFSFNAQVRNIENEYNLEYNEKKNRELERKIVALEKINATKSEYKNFDKEIKDKKSNFVNTQKQEIKLLKYRKKYFVKNEFFKWYINKIKQDANKLGVDFSQCEKEISKYTSLYEGKFNEFQEISKKFVEDPKNKDVSELFKNKKSEFKDIQKSIGQEFKNAEQLVKSKTKLSVENKIKVSNHFGIIGKWEYKIVNYKKLSHEYNLKISQELKEYSYDGDFQSKNSQAYIEFANDWLAELNTLNSERRKALLHRIKSQNSNHKNEEHKNFLIKKKEIKKYWAQELNLIKQALKQKTITNKAYKQKRTEYKIFCKEKIYETKISNDSKHQKEISKSFKYRYFGRRKIWKKVYGSKIVENRRSIPVETFKNNRFVSSILNLILPGTSELLIFKQYKKGLIMLISSCLMYALFMPFILGLSSEKFGGIFGLIDMGRSKLDWANGIMPDARYYLLGGIIAVFLLVGMAAFNISSSITAFKTGKVMEQGVRPMGWINTKRWMSNQGFPWLISLPGWVLIIFVVITPVITSLLLSFTNLGFNHEPPGKPVDWIDFKQYGKWWLFKDVGMAKSISRVLYWTVIWTVTSSTVVIALGTLVAVIVNQNRIKCKKLWRMIYIIPWAIPAFVTIMFMKSAFQSDASSLMNMVLLKLNLVDKPVDWMGRIWTVRILLILIQGWLGHSYIFLLITGNMQSIPKDIYEASEIDGAKNNQMFRYMTLPILLSSIAPLLISQFTFAFNNFTIIALFTGGGPAFVDPTPFLEGATDILISWIFKLTTSVAQIDGNMGFSAAMTMLAALVSVGIASYGFAKSAAFRRF